MKRIVLDAAAIAKLPENDIVDICDESGRVIGRFRPAVYDDPAAQPQVSEAELQRREAEGGGRPLEDILADLEKRA